MTPERRAELECLISYWQRRLRLRDWDVRLSDEDPDEGCLANNDSWGLKRVAVIRVGDSSHAAQSVVHELLHILLRNMQMGWISDAQPYMPPQSYNVLKRDSSDQEEIIIEHLTCALLQTSYIAPPGDDIYARTFGLKES